MFLSIIQLKLAALRCILNENVGLIFLFDMIFFKKGGGGGNGMEKKSKKSKVESDSMQPGIEGYHIIFCGVWTKPRTCENIG